MMAFGLVHSEITSQGRSYVGQTEVGVAEFEGATTISALRSQALIEAARDGETVLAMRIWQNGSRWKLEMTTPQGSPQWQIVFLLIAIALLIVLVAFVVKQMAGSVLDVLYGLEPFLPELEKAAVGLGAIVLIGIVLWSMSKKRKKIKATANAGAS